MSDDRPASRSRERRTTGDPSSWLGVDGALRGRDVAQPTEEDLQKAEHEVVIVRRNWQPPAD